jgi:hypothetical protein
VHTYIIQAIVYVKECFCSCVGTQGPEAGVAAFSTPLDWQCGWPELRSIQCSEALALLHNKVYKNFFCIVVTGNFILDSIGDSREL